MVQTTPIIDRNFTRPLDVFGGDVAEFQTRQLDTAASETSEGSFSLVSGEGRDGASSGNARMDKIRSRLHRQRRLSWKKNCL